MKSTADILREVRALYEANPSHAPADEYPRDGECPITALTKTAVACHVNWEREKEAQAVLEDAMDCAHGCVPGWNATHSTAAVLAAFDRAIALAEAGS